MYSKFAILDVLAGEVARGSAIQSTLPQSGEPDLTKKTVKRNNKYVTVLVVIHLLINIVHGAAHQELHVTLPPAGMLFVIAVILLCPLLALDLLWTSQERLGLLLLTVSMAVSLVFGYYNHFLVHGSDHVSAQPPGPPGSVFVITAYLLFVTEAIGTFLGLYFLREQASNAPE